LRSGSTTTKRRLSDTGVSNQSTLVCDLCAWKDPDSQSWVALTGAEEAVGTRLARMLEEASIRRLDDFGGVCETFLCREQEYLAAPRRTAVHVLTPE